MDEATFDKFMEDSCKERVVPGVVMCATNSSGTFKYNKVFGVKNLEDESKEPLKLDDILQIASCTKLLTSIAVMQCVQRGQIGLDDDVTTILPEIADWPIITGFDDDKPQTEKRQSDITLRLMLMHTAGLPYAEGAPLTQKYQQYQGRDPIPQGSTVPVKYLGPLTYEPGTRWEYGTGFDWAGLLVERLNDTTLQDYMQRNIYAPVGATDLTFFPSQRPDIQSRLAGMTLRAGAQVQFESAPEASAEPVVPFPGPRLFADQENCFGGNGVFTTVPSFLRVLHSLLKDDGRLLRSESLAEMARPQLPEKAKAFWESLRPGWMPWAFVPGEYPVEAELDFGIGSMVTVDAIEGWRGKGLMMWSGMPNLFWFVDWQHDLCGMFGTQVQPPGDRAVAKLITEFEKSMRVQARKAA